MKSRVPGLLLLSLICAPALPGQQDGIQTKTTYAKAYGETKNPVAVDPAKDLPRYPAVEPKDAIAAWQLKKGFKLELAAHEPQVRSPIAICFDENGRMFVCEMIDYSEMRDVTPHLGRISILEDKDDDGFYESSQVFADDLPWPTGLTWANGGLYVGATPDIWRFEDKDGDGKAEVREKVFTGFGTGLKILNVQGLMNSFQWGQDNRIHVLAGGGNRGVVTCLKRPDLKGVELGGRDFWFDPLTHEFGLEGGGAQYGMSFDNYGRKFGCSNSDHLQYWVYDDHYANRNPYYQMPSAKQSIAVDGGAAEVFRLSPDEPWRIIRTRWRIAGVVKGSVEGGGRVSGYFTGATGTTIYRGDVYGPDFVNNSFSGDAGGQLVHRKIIKPSPDGISLIGERPADEHGFEFAASKDTWVRVVNFANAPDGCLHICDMYREVIEHPWSIPDEIKKHIDLNSGNDRGRIYRIAPQGWRRTKGPERQGNIAKLSSAELVEMLSHPNGWHRDTAQRLLYERQDKASAPMLEKVLAGSNALAKLHAIGVLVGMKALSEQTLAAALNDADEKVVERALPLLEKHVEEYEVPDTLAAPLERLVNGGSTSKRLLFQTALTLGNLTLPERFNGGHRGMNPSAHLMLSAVEKNLDSPLLQSAVLSTRPGILPAFYLSTWTGERLPGLVPFSTRLIKIAGATANANVRQILVGYLAGKADLPVLIKGFDEGLRLAGTSLEKIDEKHQFVAVFENAARIAVAATAAEPARLAAIEMLALSTSATSSAALLQCLGAGQPEAVQSATILVLAQRGAAEVTAALVTNWPHYGPQTKTVALEVLLAREVRALALLESKQVAPSEFSASQVQALLKHKSAKVAALAKTVLASVIPPSREEVAAKFKPAITAKGDASRGQNQYLARCMACHRAGAQGLAVGPDLLTVKTKGREALLTAILEPHKEVASQFIAYTVGTKDGQTFSGIIANDTASSMTLRMMGGIEKTLQRSEIKGSSSTGQSLMPEGLETGMSVADMADLLSFIEAL